MISAAASNIAPAPTPSQGRIASVAT